MLLIRCKAKGPFFLILLHLLYGLYAFPRLFLDDNLFRLRAGNAGRVDPFRHQQINAGFPGKGKTVGQPLRRFRQRRKAQRLPPNAFRDRFLFPVVAGFNQDSAVEAERSIGQGLPRRKAFDGSDDLRVERGQDMVGINQRSVEKNRQFAGLPLIRIALFFQDCRSPRGKNSVPEDA